MRGLRVVLDTNVLVSGLTYPRSIPGQIVSAWRHGAIETVLSHYIIEEMVRVLPRLAQNRLSPSAIRDLADSLLFLADIIEPEGVQDAALRDPADQPILGTFLAARAQYLITGDKDLLALAGDYPILTPAAFWARHGG
ncbi:MAG: putative toxin-antitoxin system toxin component, PIN family [Elstera sp.]